MQLNLRRLDLAVQYRCMAVSHIRLEHFEPIVQQAIKLVGKATFVDTEVDPIEILARAA